MARGGSGERAYMESDILLLLPHSSLYVHSPHKTQGGPMGQTGPCGRSSHSGVNPSVHYAPERTRTRTRTLIMIPPREMPIKPLLPNTTRFAILVSVSATRGSRHRIPRKPRHLEEEAEGSEMNARVREGTIPIQGTKLANAPESASIA